MPGGKYKEVNYMKLNTVFRNNNWKEEFHSQSVMRDIMKYIRSQQMGANVRTQRKEG